MLQVEYDFVSGFTQNFKPVKLRGTKRVETIQLWCLEVGAHWQVLRSLGMCLQKTGFTEVL